MNRLAPARIAAVAVVAVAVAVVALTGCGTTGSVVPDPAYPQRGGPAVPTPTPSSSTADPEPRETILSSVDEQLSNLITEIEQDRDQAHQPGYAGVGVDPEHHALDLWWVGTPPPSITQRIAAPPAGLTIRLHSAKYDTATASRAIDKLMDRYPVIHLGTVENDGSGIEVETTAKGRRTLPEEKQLAEQAGMPVHVVISEPPVG